MNLKNLTKNILAVACLTLAGVASAQWSQYHGNAQRTGYTTIVGPTSFQLKWEAKVTGDIVSSPVIGPDGTIYVGPVVEDEFLTPKTALTAINPDGTIRWVFRTAFLENDLPVVSTPAVAADGTIYFGATDAAFYALNPNGTVKWKYQGQSPIIQSPVVAPDGSVYVGIDNNMCAFAPNGTLKWQLDQGDERLPGGPSLATDGTVYFARARQDISCELIAATPAGVEKWAYPLNLWYWPLAAPTVGPNGTIYVATTGIEAINPDGTSKYSVQPQYGINSYGSIVVDPQDNLYYSSVYYIWKLGPNGATIWEHYLEAGNQRLGHSWNGMLVDGQGYIYQGLGQGKRSSIDWEKQVLRRDNNGNIVASTSLPEIAGISSPAIATDGTLYIGALDGYLRAYVGTVQPLQLLEVSTQEPKLVGGQTTTGVVRLSKPAPAGGVVVNLADNSTAISVPATVTVPAGSSTATFTVNTAVIGSNATRQISGSFSGKTRNSNLTVTAGIKSLVVDTPRVMSGLAAKATITLYGVAPEGGSQIQMSSQSSVLGMPALVNVPAGQTSVSFEIQTMPINFTTTRFFTATYGSVSRNAAVTLDPAVNLTNFTVGPTTVVGGQNVTGTITLSANAPAGGLTVQASSASSIIVVPATVTVPAGTKTVNFTIQTKAVPQSYVRQVSVKVNGVTKTVNITVTKA